MAFELSGENKKEKIKMSNRILKFTATEMFNLWDDELTLFIIFTLIPNYYHNVSAVVYSGLLQVLLIKSF